MGHLSDEVDVKGLIGHELLEPAVLLLEVPYPRADRKSKRMTSAGVGGRRSRMEVRRGAPIRQAVRRGWRSPRNACWPSSRGSLVPLRGRFGNERAYSPAQAAASGAGPGARWAARTPARARPRLGSTRRRVDRRATRRARPSRHRRWECARAAGDLGARDSA